MTLLLEIAIEKKTLLQNILIAIISILLTYGILEVAYRLYQYYELTSRSLNYYSIQTVEAPLYLFDEQIGYRYKPNSELRYRRFTGDNDPMLSNSISINKHGHVSQSDYTVAKPSDEFRIAVLGDSFAASITNDIPWPTFLEKKLNNDEDLKRYLGVSTIRVLNFGMDGTGIVQWPNVYEYEAQRFDPDLVIVDFITDDILRKFIWRTTVEPTSSTSIYQLVLTCSSPPADIENKNCTIAYPIVVDSHIVDNKNDLAAMKEEIYLESVSQIPWFSLHAELVAKTMGSPSWFPTKLNLNPQYNPRYEENEAIRESLNALRAISAKHPRVLILHNPALDLVLQILDNQSPDVAVKHSMVLAPLLANLLTAGEDLGIVPMIDLVSKEYYRGSIDVEQIFNLPNDAHFSNYGAEVYSQLVYLVLKERLMLD